MEQFLWFYCLFNKKRWLFKQFFDKAQLDELFRAWEVKYINAYEMGRCKNSKMLWEIAVKKV